MALRAETLADAHIGWRIADPAWAAPLDPTFAGPRGGRWNPQRSFRTLYLNEDQVTARLNLRRFIADWTFEPEDLRGVRARSARSRDGAGRELAWFPATVRSIARPVESLPFEAWYWS